MALSLEGKVVLEGLRRLVPRAPVLQNCVLVWVDFRGGFGLVTFSLLAPPVVAD